jgi:hypothetical protein
VEEDYDHPIGVESGDVRVDRVDSGSDASRGHDQRGDRECDEKLRFSDDELVDRYRSRDQYEKRVKRAADHLAARGYITNPDRLALIAAAEHEPLPEELRCPK